MITKSTEVITEAGADGGMRPTLAAQALRDTTVEYLATTFALAEPDTQDALTGFLTDPADGLFRGPYLRVRRPFRAAADGWQRHLDWWQRGRWPYAHQAETFARLTTKDGHVPQPTLVTTGTGSGKTESFLYPVLDHCLRAKQEGRYGVKAVLLYPMNALASDQAGRLGELLNKDDRLLDVTAGLYIGEAVSSRSSRSSRSSGSASPYGKVMVERAEMRRNPPDILITNYKMLDLLLQRQQDAPLWRDADLAYIVVDEFHTYDGAQGTDVAMLLRRLAATVGASEEGRPLGSICPVATSATLASGGTTEHGTSTPTTTTPERDGGGAARSMLDVASQVFGVRFGDDSVIVEDRRALDEVLAAPDLTLPLPDPVELLRLPDPAEGPDAQDALARAVVGCDTGDARELGRRLLAHPFVHALLGADVDRPRTAAEILAAFGDTSPWRATAVRDPHAAEEALARLVALISVARDPGAPEGRELPLLLVEIHLWLRALSRVLRTVARRPFFSWPDSELAPTTPHASPTANHASPATPHGSPAGPAASASASGAGRLPSVYCRHCGRSGWAAICPERRPSALVTSLEQIYRLSGAGGAGKARVRAFLAATDAEVAEQARLLAAQRHRRGRRTTRQDATVLVLESGGDALRPLEPDEVFADGEDKVAPPENGVYVRAWYGNADADAYSREDRCPGCGHTEGIRFLGAGVAALASVVVTQLFTGGELTAGEGPDRRRTLIFNDSVQDAAHRAGFVGSRAWKFSLRTLIHEQLSERLAADGEFSGGLPLNELISSLVTRAAAPEERLLASVVPPDLHDVDRVRRLLEGKKRIPQATWELVGERLAFNTLLEFGLHSRLGRTLELTRTVAAEVALPDPGRTARTAEALYEQVVAEQRRDQLPVEDGDSGGVRPAMAHPLPESGPERLRRFEGYVRGLLEHLRLRGGLAHSWLDGYIEEEGRSRFHIAGGRREGMPAFGRKSSAPAFLLVGARSGRTDFERADSRDSWYVDFTWRCLGLEHAPAATFLSLLLAELAKEELGALAVRALGDGSPQGAKAVYGLTPGHVRLLPLADDETDRAALTCPDCGWTQTVPPTSVDVWQGLPCPVKQCAGALTPPSTAAVGRAARDYRVDYYRRLYRTARPYSVVAAEHTGVLDRKEREQVEQGFKEPARHTDANVLCCTPTLELGIDIGQLEAVLLASVPRTTASYVQRVGRAGRATGNALMVTLADTSPRALYHLADPRQLIDGPIQPPGCYLSAGELLCRQYTAHLIDLAARGLLPGVLPLPDLFKTLVGRTGWIETFSAAVTDRRDLVNAFLRLFPDIEGVPDAGVSREASNKLQRYAADELQQKLRDAMRRWEDEREELKAREAMIDEAAQALQDSVEDEAREKRGLLREKRAIGEQFGALGRVGAHAYLAENGLLPNYSLFEDGVRLDALLTHKEPPRRRAAGDDAEPASRWRTEPRSYQRPAESALTELAPGASYYVKGYRHVVSGFDLGRTSGVSDGERPAAVQLWRVCPECGHVRTSAAESDTSACPRCGGRGIGGRGALRQVVLVRKVTARDKRDNSRIIDDTDDRSKGSYTVVTAVDVDTAAIKASWRHHTATFGVDHVRVAYIRRFNVGPNRQGRRADSMFAGQEVAAPGFTLCPLCGGASDREPGHPPEQEEVSDSLLGRAHLAHHQPWCPTRRRDRRVPPRDLPIITATEHRTEALRILLPAATLRVPERLASFSAALHLGLAEKYGGDPAHIRSTPSSEPDRDTELTRHYLVLYDSLPGGTGYLQRLAEPEELKAVLRAAQQVLQACPCVSQSRPACHLCLLGHAPQREYPLLDRQEALWMLTGLLGEDGDSGWEMTEIGSDEDGDRLRFAQQAESDLERRFIDCLDRWLEDPGTGAVPEHGETPTGRLGKHFQLRRPDGSTVRWELVAQKDLPEHRTRPDLLLRPRAGDDTADGAPPLPVAIYLDGYRWHASERTNRIAADASKRASLRADGMLVWQLTWDDVMAWERELRTGDGSGGEAEHAAADEPLAALLAGLAANAAWPPYPVEGPDSPGGRVRAKWESRRRDPAEVDALLYSGAIPSLLGFLRNPDLARWRNLAVLCASVLVRQARTVEAAPDTAAPWIEATLRGEPAPRVIGTGLNMVEIRDHSGLPLVLLRDGRDRSPRWSAIAVLDDRAEAVSGDSPDHRRRWKAWLCWGNILQFLDPTGSGRADGLTLAHTGLDAFDAQLLAATHGTAGELLTALGEKLPDADDQAPPDATAAVAAVGRYAATPAEPPTPANPRDPTDHLSPTELERRMWDVVLRRLSYVADPEVDAFAQRLADHGRVPVAQAGLDVAGVSCPIELAWPSHRLGVVLREDVHNTTYMTECHEAGWTVREPGGWSIEELVARLAEEPPAEPLRSGA